jgi:hypothetical protein
MTDFAQPIYADETAGSVSTDSAADDQQIVSVDLNDPSLLEESLEFDASANPYEFPPPVPDGRYTAKLKQLNVKDADGKEVLFAVKQDMDYSKGAPGKPVFLANGKPKLYVSTALECRIQDPSGKFDNIPVFDRFVDSRTARNGGIAMVRILQCLGVKVPSNMSAGQLKELFQKTLASEPTLEIETSWEGQPDQDTVELYKERGERLPKRVKGMHRFPERDGKRVPEITVPGKLGDVAMRAQAVVVGYFPKK